MIWHIFKKDAKLLWWLALAAAALRFAQVAAAQAMGLFPDARLRNLSYLLSMGGILVVGIAICAVVHQDSIPGVRQDWLVRPVPRRDLLAAKFLWVLLLIQFPIFIGDFTQGSIAGSGVATSLAATASRSIFLLLALDLPFLALASVTRSLLEALSACVAVFLAFATFMSLMAGSSGQWQPTMNAGIEWITVTALVLIMLAGTAVIFRLQFFRRRTLLSRYLMGAAAILCILVTLTPWQIGFAIQKSLNPVPSSATAPEISFDPTLGRAKALDLFPRVAFELPVQILLPLHITGLSDNFAVHSDHIQIRLFDRGGHTYNLDSLSNRGTLRPNAPPPYQIVGVPGDLYRRLKDQPVRLEIHYSLTLFQLASTHRLPAANADERIPGVGWCATRINPSGTAVQLSCEQAGRGPSCSVVYLEHVPSGQRNPERFDCERPDYSPYLNWALVPDGMARFGGALTFRDFNGLAHYPVNSSMIRDSRIVMQFYQPREHFTRKVAIPEIRLSDWEGTQ